MLRSNNVPMSGTGRRPRIRVTTPFWCDEDGFTSRDFKVVTTTGTWILVTLWMAIELIWGKATTQHLEFYQSVSQVFMVLLGGMAANQVLTGWSYSRATTQTHPGDVAAGRIPDVIDYNPMTPDRAPGQENPPGKSGERND